MRTISIRAAALAALLVGHVPWVHAQGFINLDFESTSLSPGGPPGSVTTAIGLPGWAVSIGGVPESTILYNNGTFGSSSIAILGSGNHFNPIIQGNFSAMLVAGASPTNSAIAADASINQSGLVPADAKTLLFSSYSQGSGIPDLAVALDGQALTAIPVQIASTYTLYGADVSAFAGHTANLSFTARSNHPLGFEVFGLDSIVFSPEIIPEPGVLWLSALGAVALVCRARCSRKGRRP